MLSNVTNHDHPCHRYTMIAFIFGDDEELFRFFFNAEGSELNFGDARTTLRIAANHFDESRYITVKLAIDVWLNTKRTRALEIAGGLNAYKLENVINALFMWRSSRDCSCQNCHQRFAP